MPGTSWAARPPTRDHFCRPPAFAPQTLADTALKRLTPEMFEDARLPAEVISDLDQNFTPGCPFLLVAQNASVEANIIHLVSCEDVLAFTPGRNRIPCGRRGASRYRVS
ncbi:hypothetical protein ACWCOW_30565, partial [Streptomyces sp. NPDC001939]